jgi:hypothetical protein
MGFDRYYESEEKRREEFYTEDLVKEIAELKKENQQIIELSDLIKTKADEYKARNAELRDALQDTLYLIMEHGSPQMKAHATRLGKSFKIAFPFGWQEE